MGPFCLPFRLSRVISYNIDMTKEGLVNELQSEGYLKTSAVVRAFQKIDRTDFVPPDLQDEAYENYPLPIGYGQTISQPLTVAFMLELLAPKAGEKILDVGAGSGWQSALLAYCVSRATRINAEQDADKCGYIRENRRGNPRTSAGWVVAIERIPELKEVAERNIGKYDFITNGIVKVVVGDGSRGYKSEAPYDKIVAAAAGEKIPDEWKRQLKVGGRIVAPIGQSIIVLDKIGKNEYKERDYYGFSFVPLVRG